MEIEEEYLNPSNIEIISIHPKDINEHIKLKEKMKKIEDFAMDYYLSQGKKVFKTNSQIGKNILNSYIKIPELKKRINIRKGTPDLFIFNPSKKLIFEQIEFIEVKSPDDGIRIDQLIWATNLPFPISFKFVYFWLNPPSTYKSREIKCNKCNITLEEKEVTKRYIEMCCSKCGMSKLIRKGDEI